MGRRTFLIQTHRRSGWTVVSMLFAAMICFVAGILLPFTAVTKLWLFENQVSVYQGLDILWNAGEIFLFLILFIFTICFPFIKINALLMIWLYPGLTGNGARRFYKFVSNMGKWSMLDVFVVAILVVTLRSGGLASIEMKNGVFLFFVSVMLTQLASLWTGRVASRLEK